MKTPTLVVSNPPHEEVDLDAAAHLLGLDVFTTRLKTRFAAPEILGACGPDEAVELVGGLRTTGLRATILQGGELAALPWPDPVTYLAFDDSCLRATVGGRALEIAYDIEVVAVVCQPPADFAVARPVELGQAMASGHGPTIAEAMQERGFVDLYFDTDGSPSRVSVVPRMFGIETSDLATELGRRFRSLRMDRRLVGVRPRGRPMRREKGVPAPEEHRRRGYSFGTHALSDLLGSIEPELRDAPQFEIGSRIARALNTSLPGAV